MTQKQKNKIRVKYLKEGIKLLEQGIEPRFGKKFNGPIAYEKYILNNGL